MRCDTSRELISADLDGELEAVERHALADHLGDCADCSAYAADAARLHRRLRVTAATDVPDLTAAIMARADEVLPRAEAPIETLVTTPITTPITTPVTAPTVAPAAAATEVERRRHERRIDALRYTLGALAVTQLVLSVPELLGGSDLAEPVHVARHLGGWDLAFAIGLLVVAVQPWRARGLLPMAAALAGVMGLTALIDVLNHQTPGLTEAPHVLELCGLVIVWQLARAQRTGDADDGTPRRGWPEHPIRHAWAWVSGPHGSGGRPAMHPASRPSTGRPALAPVASTPHSGTRSGARSGTTASGTEPRPDASRAA